MNPILACSVQQFAIRIWAGLLATSISDAAPVFGVGAGGGDGSEPIPVRVYFDGRDSPTETGALTFDFDPNILQATESCVSRIGNPLPDRLNFTHNVSCSVDNSAGRVQMSFSPLFRGITVSKRLSLGRIEFTVVENSVPVVGVTHIPLDIVSVTFPGETGAGSVSGQVSIVQGWPLDSHEPDDSPKRASLLSESDVNQFRSVFGFLQTHTLDNLDAEDWAFYEVETCMPLFPTLRVSPIEPIDLPSFRPIVTLFAGARLQDGNVQPLATYGDCSDPPGQDLVVHDVDLSQSVFIRVTHCDTPPASGLGYSLRLSFDLFCPFGVVNYRGRVSEEETGLSAGVFLRSSSNQYGASSPVTGEFNLVGLAEQAIDVEVLSDEYFPTTVALPALTEGVPSPDFEIVVRRKEDKVFASSFE